MKTNQTDDTVDPDQADNIVEDPTNDTVDPDQADNIVEDPTDDTVDPDQCACGETIDNLLAHTYHQKASKSAAYRRNAMWNDAMWRALKTAMGISIHNEHGNDNNSLLYVEHQDCKQDANRVSEKDEYRVSEEATKDAWYDDLERLGHTCVYNNMKHVPCNECISYPADRGQEAYDAFRKYHVNQTIHDRYHYMIHQNAMDLQQLDAEFEALKARMIFYESKE